MQSVTSLLQRPLSVESIGSVRHFFCSSALSLSSPPSPAHELLYVASQEASLSLQKERCFLKTGDAFLLPSSVRFSLSPAGQSPPCLLVISFTGFLPPPDFLSGQAITLSRPENRLLAQFLLETKNNPSDSASICCPLLAQFFALLTVRLSDISASDRLLQSLLTYLQSHLHTTLTLSRICCDNSISRSRLEKLFYEKYGCGAMAFFSRMKTEAAKDLIRLGNMNVTQVAASLGYSSVHYFSRLFKKHTKMTPTEYSRSIGKDSGTSPDL